MPALVLMYHDLARNPERFPPGHRPYVLDPEKFKQQMDAVARCGVPVRTVAEWSTGIRPRRAVVPTFDDGHTSNYENALPILLEYGFKATFFITAGQIGTGEVMSWAQIRALHAAGMEIGSHTLTHRAPSMLDDEQLRYELVESRRILEDGLGSPVISISSPTGFFNPRMRVIAREVGYQALCFGQFGLAADEGDLFSLQRVAVKRSLQEPEFGALLRFDSATIRKFRRRQALRDLARRTLGRSAYLRMRRILIGRVSKT